MAESSILSFLVGGGWSGWRSGRAKRVWAAAGGPVGAPVEYEAARRGGRGSPMAANPVGTPMPIPSPAPPPPARDRILLRLAMGHPEALGGRHTTGKLVCHLGTRRYTVSQYLPHCDANYFSAWACSMSDKGH